MKEKIQLCWLGQSGFLVRAGDTVLLADPYLSDSCAKLKSKLDHTRGTPIVRDPADLKVDLYLITHCHADHFDPETIIPVMENNPDCRYPYLHPTIRIGRDRCSPHFDLPDLLRR